MQPKVLNMLLVVLTIVSGFSAAWSAQPTPPAFPANATFTTVATTPFAIEGLTMDATGNFYTTGRQPDTAKKCPVWRISANGATRVSVGFLPNAASCNPSGIAFDELGALYIADASAGGNVWKVSPHPVGCASDDSTSPSCATIVGSPASSPSTPFAAGVPGTNGVAFDKNANLWTGDGTTGFGRVWRITGAGANCTPPTPSLCEEAFRIQPMNNDKDFGGLLDVGVGRVNATIQAPTGATNPQNLVANGLAFNQNGDLFVADTARGALWLVKFNPDGSVKSERNCDATFDPNTLCLENIFVADLRLDGADGIAMDQNGNIWVAANERNAIVIFGQGVAAEVFRNPVNGGTGLRNAGDLSVGNNRILELPTSPFLLNNRFCTANSDGNRRDNSPNSAGEISPAGPKRGKISCMDQELTSPGLPLPVQ